MSESERHQMIGRWTDEKATALRKRAEIDQKLADLGQRLERLGGALREVDRSISRNTLADLLRFGVESGITVDGLVEILNERQRLGEAIRGCEANLTNLGIG